VLGGVAASGVDIGVARLLAGNGATDLAFDGDGRTTVDTGGQDIGTDVAVLLELAVGRYRLVAVATDAAGNRSAAKRRAFRIVRR
jgi:hypothetical protein